MVIPEFPEAREISLADRPMVESLLAARKPELSAYTFTNMFAWRESHAISLSKLNGVLLVHYNFNGRRICLEPLGECDVVGVVEQAFARMPGSSLEFAYFDAETARPFAEQGDYQVELDRDNSDYLYLSRDLIELAGRKYDAKRNFINRFKLNYEYDYIPLSGRRAMEAHEFVTKWCEDRSCETSEGLRMELCAVYQMLVHFDALNICGGAIRVAGNIVALEIGERLNPETMVIHVEKADSTLDGLYQLINNEFCAHEAAGLKYVNREQDLGVPGLRKAKKSYHPTKLVEAYRIRRTGNGGR